MRNFARMLAPILFLIAACGGFVRSDVAPTKTVPQAIQNGDVSMYGRSFGTGGFWLQKFDTGLRLTTISLNPGVDRPLGFVCDWGSWGDFMTRLQAGQPSALDPAWDLKAEKLPDGSIHLWHDFRGTRFETQGTAEEWAEVLAWMDANPTPSTPQ